MSKLFKFLLFSVVAVVATAVASPAEASFRMRVENLTTGGGAVVTDNVAGGADLDPTAGSILYSGGIGSFTVTVSIGTAAPPLAQAPGTYSQLHLTVTVSKAGGSVAESLQVSIETDMLGAGVAPAGVLQLNGSIGGTQPATATVTANTYVSPSNAVPAYGVDSPPGAFVAGALGANPGDSVAAWTPDYSFTGAAVLGGTTSSSAPFVKGAGAYSMFSTLTWAWAAGGGGGSVDLDATVTPEPASVVLALAGAFPFFCGRYLRRRKS